MAYDTTELCATADIHLRIRLAAPGLTRLLRGDKPLVGALLTELFPSLEVLRDLRLLQAGVARAVRLATLEGERCLVASLAATGIASEAPVIVIRLTPLPGAPASDSEIFVGRAEELDAFDEFLAGPEGAMFVLEGPLGMGKTALLDAYERRCRKVAASVVRVDCRAMTFRGDIISTLAEMHGSLMGFATTVAARPWILMLDHFDVGLAPSVAERAAFFRTLPPTCRLVVAIRSHPTPFPFLFPHHKPVLCRLGPLSPPEVDLFAARYEIDDAVGLRRAAGHPLSLRVLTPSLTHVEPLDDLAYEGALPVPRAALKIAALPHRITEDLLVTLLGDAELAGRTYDALGSICMTDNENFGLRMPEMLRRPLMARLERRNPARFAALEVEIVRHHLRRLNRVDGRHRALAIDDLFASFEGHARLRAVYGSPDAPVVIRRLGREAADDVRAFLRQIGRANAAAVVARLRNGTPTYVAEKDHRITGLMQFAILSPDARTAGEDRRSPALRAFMRRLGGAEVRLAVLYTLAMSAHEEREWGETAQALAREHLRSLLMLRGLTASIVFADVALRVLDVPSDDTVEIEGIRVRVRNFRETTLAARVLDSLDRKESDWWCAEEGPAPEPGLTVDAVRIALAGLAERGDDAQLVAAIDALPDPRQREVLRAIYIDRRGKHELIAAEMGLPYSTFRRHHARGIDRLRQLLSGS